MRSAWLLCFLLIAAIAPAQRPWESAMVKLPPFAQPGLDQRIQHILVQMDAFDGDSAMVLIGEALGAIDLDKDPEPRYYLLSYRAEVLYYQGFYNEAVRDLSVCADLADRMHDSLFMANVYNLQGLLQENIGRGASARDQLRKALAWFPAHPAARYPVSELFHIHGNMGKYLLDAGVLDSARFHLQRSLELAVAAGAERAVAVAWGQLGGLSMAEQQPDSALAYFQRSFELVDGALDRDVALDGLMGIAKVYAGLKDIPRTRQALARAEAYLQQYASRIGLASRRDQAKSTYQVLQRIQDLNGALAARERWARLDSTINEGNIRSALATQAALHRTDASLALEREHARLTAETMKRLELSRNMVIAGAAAAVAILALLAIILQNKRRNYRKLAGMQLAQAEQEKTIAELRIREQVGRDMHDDLGAGLSSLKMRSEMAARNETDAEKRGQWQRLAGTAGELIGSLRQIIWAMNDDQATVEDLVVYATNHVRRSMDEHGISLQVRTPGPWPDGLLTSEQRRNIFLVIKEATHNIVKHAGAKNVELSMDMEGHLLAVRIADDGIGMPATTRAEQGNGLRNMARRMQALQGELEFRNGENAGTLIRFRTPCKPVPRGI
ncbi:MAG: hypothetical protein IPN44_04065 [Flavobacteriales bacterium]|nr:hypothetical protein [Flavobacteriales bacterium]